MVRENTARKVFDFGTANAFAPEQQVAAEVEKLKPVLGSATYAADAQLFEQVKARAAQMMRRRSDNPAGYVLREPGVAAAYDAAAQDPKLLPDAIGKSLAVQEAIGIAPDARRILPDAHGQAARIAVLPAAEVPDAIAALRQQYGKYWGQARGELVAAGLPDPYVVLSTLDERRRPWRGPSLPAHSQPAARRWPRPSAHSSRPTSPVPWTPCAGRRSRARMARAPPPCASQPSSWPTATRRSSN